MTVLVNRLCCAFTALAISGMASTAGGVECMADSGSQRAALLELYTSEGCDSCPPADRWVGELPNRGYLPARLVTLAFHVDYWNYLGWHDPHSKPQYSERQRFAASRSRARVVYTPQLLLNGRDYRRAAFFEDLGERLSAINREPAQARINLRVRTEHDRGLRVTGNATVEDPRSRIGAHAYLALYENSLSSQITAGENKGKRLRHDFVVRELVGPFPVDSEGKAPLDHGFKLASGWKTPDLHIAAFVQNVRSGDVLQALALPYCSSSGAR